MHRNASPARMTGALVPIPPGLAEQLARIARFRALETVQPEELDAVALWLLGRVHEPAHLWEQLQGDCNRLWFLITDDWDVEELDELPERASFPGMTPDQEELARYERTRNRLCDDIERAVWIARYRFNEQRRSAS